MQAAGLSKLVEYNKKKVEELHLQELSVSLADTISADPPLPVNDAITLVQDRKKEWSLPDLEITKVCFSAPAIVSRSVRIIWCLSWTVVSSGSKIREMTLF